MQVATGQAKTLRLDDRPAEGWQRLHLLERIEALEMKNGLLRAKVSDLRDRLGQLEAENRHLREKLLDAVGTARAAT